MIPSHLDGMSVLDLGSGAGQDCFILSKLVGESGHVTGIDMTDEQVYGLTGSRQSTTMPILLPNTRMQLLLQLFLQGT